MTANAQVARRLNEVADLLRDQGANSFRIQAYRRGALTVAHLERPVSEILEQDGLDALRQLPGIGDRLAIAIRDIMRLGRLPMLDRLRGESDAEELLRTVPAIGRIHVRRLHEEKLPAETPNQTSRSDGRGFPAHIPVRQAPFRKRWTLDLYTLPGRNERRLAVS
jgi:DNA polymerase/3'-5' exonuclease PolX